MIYQPLKEDKMSRFAFAFALFCDFLTHFC